MTVGTCIEKDTLEKIFLNVAKEAQKQMIENIQKPKAKVIVIAGPTACGKTDFSIRLAQVLGGEIISADSMQVYRGMDIGTAKATLEQRERARHHLIDIHDLKEHVNIVDFYYEAQQAIRDILSRNSVPIIVGGSGFYLHSLLYGPPSGPPSDIELRKALEEEIELLGPAVLYERVLRMDPQYAHTITKHDKQKIVRALEIMAINGKKVSDLSWKTRKTLPTYQFKCWFLHRPRELLYQRINERCDRMVEYGFLEEVKNLILAGLKENPSASQAIGYKQALLYLESAKTPEDYLFFIEEFKKCSRKYAKKQFTWFRREPLFKWLDMDVHDPEIALEIVADDYKK